MNLLLKVVLYLHIIAGALTLLVGPIAIFYNFKNPVQHRRFGKIFYYAMLVVCISAIIGFLRRPEVIFYQFLLGISIIVLAGIARGIRTIWLMRGDKVRPIDWVYTSILGTCGLIMVGRSIYLYLNGGHIAFIILFAVFGAGALQDTAKNYQVFSGKKPSGGKDWMVLHLNSMLGAFIASTTAFTVNAAHFLPWYVQWFGPTILLVPIIIYFTRKVKGV